MAKIRDPLPFAEHFGIDPSKLERMGILNPVLNVDTKLFIDPVLLETSSHSQVAKDATRTFRRYFEDIIKLLQASSQRGDVAWKAAQSRLRFREVSFNCLGYGAASIHGRAFGRTLTARLVDTAKQIVDLGINDPDLFILIPLLEEGVGPDLISDLTTNVVAADLAQLTDGICKQLGIPTKPYEIRGRPFLLPENPTEGKSKPVLLVPTDILRSLPLASDWSEVADAAADSAAARDRINRLIGDIWSARTRKQKAELRAAALASKNAFEALLLMIREVDLKAYDLKRDPEGLTVWRAIHQTIAQQFPLRLSLGKPLQPKQAIAVVEAIVTHFETLIEKKGLWKILWSTDRPHKEKVPQMVFFALADAYCKANGIDVTPEADTGSGVVDFKFSHGYNIRILVEVKLSTNSQLIAGYEKQLETYKEAESPLHAIYLVVDVGGMGKKEEKLRALKRERAAQHLPVSEILIVDGKPKPSASKL